MISRSKFLFALLLSMGWALSLAGQGYTYTVTTLLPENSQLFDDGLCLDENGVLYGSYWGMWPGAAGTHVGRYRPDGSIDTLAIGFNRPNGMNYKDGTIYLANSAASQVLTLDTAGNFAVIAGVSNATNALPVPGTDSLVVASYNQNRLYGVRNGTVTSIATLGLLSGPVGLAYDTAGVLYVANFNNGRILRYNGNGQLSQLVDLGGGIGFLTYSDGALLATNHVDKRIYRVSLDGSLVTVIAGSGQGIVADGVGTAASFRYPNGIVATPSGDTIYVSEFEGKALRRIVRTPVVTGAEGKGPTGRVRPYPVPARDRIWFDNGQPAGLEQVELYDLRGKMVLRTGEWSTGLRCGDLAPGLYEVVGYDAAGRQVMRAKVPIAH